MSKANPKKLLKPERNHRHKLRNVLTAGDYVVYEPPNAADLRVVRVFVNFGIESGVKMDGELKRLVNRRNLPTVPGDEVYTDGVSVLGIKPRGKVLARYADESGIRLIASHLTQVGLVVSGSIPVFQEGLLDRYLVFCRITELPLFLVLNKMDEATPGVVERVLPYQKAGVDIYCVSATTGLGMKMLEKRLMRGNTVLSGLSGVGKSTLVNRLVDQVIPTQEVSTWSGRGRHTTTAAEAYELDEDGKILLIDSPGIRKFGFLGVKKQQVIRGFYELEEAATGCKYEDCLHETEDGCVVRAAVEAGKIDLRRYEAYRELLETIEAEK